MQAIPQSRQGILLTTAGVFRVVPGVNRLGVVARAREETSLSGSGSTYRGKRTVASVPMGDGTRFEEDGMGDLAQRKEKPHVRGSRAAETVAQDAARSDDEAFLEVGVTFATDCLGRPHSLRNRGPENRCPSYELSRWAARDRRAREETSLPSSGKAYGSTGASARRDTIFEDGGVEELRRSSSKSPRVQVTYGATRVLRSRRKHNAVKTRACLVGQKQLLACHSAQCSPQ
ncbi:hypothetical protein TNCT_654181 [Trichonephila clavata]|uniref:Uncharacterized protein n=1 Tax=Trichonephila clavata TaxID=2740835 RepID=A0A8X6F9E3_TRICU|nr:hypothetical protein TNCT_654181 [Trichonephila clavata]